MPVRLIGAAVAASLSISGCAERRTGDLDEVRQHGELRVVVRPGFLDATAPPSEEGDQETELRHLAARLGVELVWLEPRRHDEVLQWLSDGRADMAVSRFSEALVAEAGSASTAPVEWVSEYLVVARDMPGLTLDDLDGGKVYVQESLLGPALESLLVDHGLDIVALPEDLSLEEILQSVADGDVPLTVADSGILEREPIAASLQLIGPLVERRPVVWAVRPANLQLRRAIDDFLFAEKVLTRRSRSRVCRDLPEIRVARVLRVVTRNSPTTCYVTRGGLVGFEYELAVAFAREQRLRLELSIPPPDVDPLDWLEQGFGDIAMLHEPLDPPRDGHFLVSTPYRRVDLVSVSARRQAGLWTFEDLAGVRVAASGPVGRLISLLPLDPSLDVVPVPDGFDAFGALKKVARGEVDVAVVDRDAARLELETASGLHTGPVVLPDVELVWVLNTSSPVLRDRVDAFLDRAARSGLVRQLASKNLSGRQVRLSPRLPPIPDGDLTPYDEYLTWAARQFGLDWRLLASLMYEESRFDPDAVGPGGSSGLFQFMPFTWRELGVEDPHHPGEAIEAGARYLRSLMDKFADLDLPDRVAMAIASYNVGPRHVFDARRLAREMGLNPDRWLGNVETAMYLLDDPEVARRFPAGACRCRRGAAYTRRILRRYAAYAEQFPPS
ncbi:MAG: transporter substrate-binding domain-containing protein [Holophagae bacterium]